MEYNPFYKKNKAVKKEYLNGNLLVAGNSAIIPLQFKYGQDKPRAYINQFANGIAIDYVGVTERIYTTRIDLPFAKGSKIQMHDGFIMTVESIDKDINENTGDTKAFYVNLNGGGQWQPLMI